MKRAPSAISVPSVQVMHYPAERERTTDNTRKTNGPLPHKPRSDRNVQKKIIVIKLIAVVIS